MKLKFVGMICPICSEPATYVGPLRQHFSVYIGYTRECWCNCTEERFEDRTWMMLFDENRAFKTVVPGGVFFLLSAGQRRDDDEIPF